MGLLSELLVILNEPLLHVYSLHDVLLLLEFGK